MVKLKFALFIMLLPLMMLNIVSCKDRSEKKEENKIVVTAPSKLQIRQIKLADEEKLVKEFKNWIKEKYSELKWTKRQTDLRLDAELLKASLSLGSNFMINNQKPDGNFNYQFDFVTMKFDPGDNQVRQAGALWGTALIFQYTNDPEIKKVLDKSLEFFFKHTIDTEFNGSKIVLYPGENSTKTGTIALVSLAIIDYLRVYNDGKVQLEEKYVETLKENLKGYLQHLLNMQLGSLHFSDEYFHDKIAMSSRHNPYADGEVLLALVKAGKYLDYPELIQLFKRSSFVIAKTYTMDQWPRYPDSNLTKGFFQWSCMAFWEYQDGGWEDSEYYGDYVITMSWWMIYTHHTLLRTRNTAYAYEGIIPAYQIALSRNYAEGQEDLEYTIDTALTKLTSWQVGGPLESLNRFLSNQSDINKIAIGGVMNHKREPLLRVDVTQHQMHAVILALKYMYNH